VKTGMTTAKNWKLLPSCNKPLLSQWPNCWNAFEFRYHLYGRNPV